MRILAFDTSMAALSVAVLDTANGQLAGSSATMETGQAELLVPEIAAQLAAAGVALTDIDRLIVTTGPGTFTGVRIGLSVARGLALAGGLPLVGISSLHGIAAGAIPDIAAAEADGHDIQRLLVAMQTRGDAVFHQLFDRDGAPATTPAVSSVAELAQVLPPGVDILVLGTAAAGLCLGSDRTALRLWPGARHLAAPCASEFAALAEHLPVPSGRPQPTYLREPDARPPVAGPV